MSQARWVEIRTRPRYWKTSGYVGWGYDTYYEKQDRDGFLLDARTIRTPTRQQHRMRSKYIPAGPHRNVDVAR